MSSTATPSTEVLWRHLIVKHGAFAQAARDFLKVDNGRENVLRDALRGPDRDMALWVLRSLRTDEQERFFPELIHLSRCAHGPFETAWQTILAMPRDWVLAHIEKEMEPILAQNEEDDWWMLLHLCEKLDRQLAQKLAQQASMHINVNIRQLGEEFILG